MKDTSAIRMTAPLPAAGDRRCAYCAGGATPIPSKSAESVSSDLAASIAFGMMAERARIASIMDDPAAELFPRAAWLLARNGEMTLEQAREMLAINAAQLAINAALKERETAVMQ